MFLHLSGKLDFTVSVEVDEATGEVEIKDIWSDSAPEFTHFLDEDYGSLQEDDYRLAERAADAIRRNLEPKVTDYTAYLEDN